MKKNTATAVAHSVVLEQDNEELVKADFAKNHPRMTREEIDDLFETEKIKYSKAVCRVYTRFAMLMAGFILLEVLFTIMLTASIISGGILGVLFAGTGMYLSIALMGSPKSQMWVLGEYESRYGNGV